MFGGSLWELPGLELVNFKPIEVAIVSNDTDLIANK